MRQNIFFCQTDGRNILGNPTTRILAFSGLFIFSTRNQAPPWKPFHLHFSEHIKAILLVPPTKGLASHENRFQSTYATDADTDGCFELFSPNRSDVIDTAGKTFEFPGAFVPLRAADEIKKLLRQPTAAVIYKFAFVITFVILFYLFLLFYIIFLFA